ncbi:MAG: ABC transporter substrate-binding protein [Proteobacteria bacterium]|nr:ABC transporter substrate-binding protein [Pseudomonadota bacterium]
MKIRYTLGMRAVPLSFLLSALLLCGCADSWNDPYPASERGKNILYSSFAERPKHLDPAQSYTSDEWDLITQILEPPFQYHYLKRPYELITATAETLPKPRYFDSADSELPADADAVRIAYSVYDIRIKSGVRYQPHPAFVPENLQLPEAELRNKFGVGDFKRTGTRELTADDYVYQIKRLGHPRINSPIFGHMTDYIVGLKEFGDALKEADRTLVAAAGRTAWLDLGKSHISGVQVVDRYTYRIRVKGKYPQFLYWLALPFFAPVPVEADRFYAQAGFAEKNLTLDWWPVGTGPYMLVENNPNARMVLARNPNFRGEAYPAEGEEADRQAGLLADAGKVAPFIDQVVFSREKEGIPYWNKFMQGYYDQSGISSDTFDQAVKMGIEGEAGLTPEMEERGIRLKTALATSVFYLAFNWNDAVVGGSGKGGEEAQRARKLRQAISIAVDYEEFISIFANGRGLPAQGPIAPGIFGYRDGKEGLNPLVYDWVDGKPQRKSIDAAKKLLVEAGYPGGREAKSGQPLVLYLDTTGGGPGGAARLDWYRKQFGRIGIQLEVRATDWNRFQEKIRKGNTQMFFLGWNADYPDPENFLFLLYGPNSTLKNDGENKANYQNPEFDRLYERVKNMDNGPERQAVIDRLVAVLREDAPWVWGYNPKDYGLYHSWLSNLKPNSMARNGLKYYRLDTQQRSSQRAQWNRPLVWPLLAIMLALALLTLPAFRAWQRRAHRAARPPDGAARPADGRAA